MLYVNKRVGNMAWECAAIDHGVTFYSNGKISPCCLIDHTYRKDIIDIVNQPFADLKTETAPDACRICVQAEQNNLPSYRQHFARLKTNAPGYQFIDIRNTNFCNYKCRSCCTDNSSQWAIEQGMSIPIIKQDILEYKKYIINSSVQQVYYTGGEPFINSEQWEILEEMSSSGHSQHISLVYNTNVSTLKFKDKNILDLWKNFKSVSVMASIDAVGPAFDYIRSGGHWPTVEENLIQLKDFQQQYSHLKIQISTTVSILNIWFVSELLEYLKDYKVTLTDLHYPDYLALTTIPDNLKHLALKCVDDIEKLYPDKNKCDFFRSQINNNSTQYLFRDTVMQTLLLDNIRNENLFNLLPFKKEALMLI
jgi:MoaA/NifB/PqqE/SkfB family radical SAM enzyme